MKTRTITSALAAVAAVACLAAMPHQSHAEEAAATAAKERLVLMPLRVSAEDAALLGAMETALTQGLQERYEVFSGEQVAQKAREIFLKESRSAEKKDCDETRCMQDIAIAFQAELISTANVTRQQDGYFLALSIRNIFDNKVVYSNSVPCRNCDAYQVVDKLKELSGASVAAKAEAKAKTFRDCPECPEMAAIPAGSYIMGSSEGTSAEKPAHLVAIGRPFAIGVTEVTQAQWQAVMGTRPSEFKNCGGNCPVEKVSWDDAQGFVKKLSAMTGKQYRLPTEAEWEYACRAGTPNKYCGGDNADSVAWFGAKATPPGNSRATNPVAKRQANAFGLYDMSGNVWEWVEDAYHDNYNGAPVDGVAWRQGPSMKRVLRGGSWYHPEPLLRATTRGAYDASSRNGAFGFRVARALP